jgi:hypothetical protein
MKKTMLLGRSVTQGFDRPESAIYGRSQEILDE